MNIRGLDYRDYFIKAFNQNEDLRNELDEKSEVIAKIYSNEKTENYRGEDREKKQEDFLRIVNDILGKENLKVESEIHDFFGDNIVRVVDDITGELVSETPSKTILDMMAKLCEMSGVLIDKRA